MTLTVETITEIKDRILSGGEITYEEALTLLEIEDPEL